MIIKAVCALIGLPVLALVGLFVWGGLRSGPAPLSESDALIPAAILSEQLSDGMIEAQVYVLGNLGYRIEIQFSPSFTSNISSTMPPEVSLSMESMHMDGLNQPLELVGNGAWQGQGEVPMAGIWIVNVGYGDEFAEVPFAAR